MSEALTFKYLKLLSAQCHNLVFGKDGRCSSPTHVVEARLKPGGQGTLHQSAD